MLGSDSEGLSAQYHSEVRVLKPKGRFLTTRVESRVRSLETATRNRKFSRSQNDGTAREKVL